MGFREISHSMRGLIWLLSVSTLLAAFFGVHPQSHGGSVSVSTIFMGGISALLLIWAFWATFSAHGPPKK